MVFFSKSEYFFEKDFKVYIHRNTQIEMLIFKTSSWAIILNISLRILYKEIKRNSSFYKRIVKYYNTEHKQTINVYKSYI